MVKSIAEEAKIPGCPRSFGYMLYSGAILAPALRDHDAALLPLRGYGDDALAVAAGYGDSGPGHWQSRVGSGGRETSVGCSSATG